MWLEKLYYRHIATARSTIHTILSKFLKTGSGLYKACGGTPATPITNENSEFLHQEFGQSRKKSIRRTGHQQNHNTADSSESDEALTVLTSGFLNPSGGRLWCSCEVVWITLLRLCLRPSFVSLVEYTDRDVEFRKKSNSGVFLSLNGALSKLVVSCTIFRLQYIQ